jgi:hypothetical protein
MAVATDSNSLTRFLVFELNREMPPLSFLMKSDFHSSLCQLTGCRISPHQYLTESDI